MTLDQHARFARAFSILERGIAERAFPGAAVAVTHEHRLIACKGLGRFTYESHSTAVLADTLFDLASLTKPLATTGMAMILYERGLLDLDMPVRSFVPEFAADDSRRSRVTFRMLLAHSSGLPAYERLFERASSRRDILQAACATPLTADPGARAQYSDLGFIILGEALARLAGEQIHSFCQLEIFGPLGMSRTSFNPPVELRASIPPTEHDRTFRRRILQGEVHDENAFAMGGVAGHAGLFAPAGDVALFAECMLRRGEPILREDTVALFTTRDPQTPGSSRTLGWDTPTHPSQSGRHLSARAFGHLGFTGTSLWIDPARQLSITLLTNRTWPDRSSQAIRQLRPAFHDAIVEAL